MLSHHHLFYSPCERQIPVYKVLLPCTFTQAKEQMADLGPGTHINIIYVG